jgi:hypothetical protein
LLSGNKTKRRQSLPLPGFFSEVHDIITEFAALYYPERLILS